MIRNQMEARIPPDDFWPDFSIVFTTSRAMRKYVLLESVQEAFKDLQISPESDKPFHHMRLMYISLLYHEEVSGIPFNEYLNGDL